MKKILDIINEVIIEQGIGDKFLHTKYGIEPEFSDFEKQYKSYTMNKDNDQIIHTVGNWNLIKNPQSLKNIGPSARGVILPNGDLYLESYGGEYIHYDILKILAQKGILPANPRKTWSKQLPQESGFLTVQRYKDSPYISIGESNRLIYDKEDYNKYIKYYDQFLDKARSKNPQIQFKNKLVGTKFFNIASESVVMSC